ncbi:MAG: hypothetical protein E7590_06860 [Ruminococcaceae bacterium]|nr:hypothetical protein [Oscillospiraceae bacterium]
MYENIAAKIKLLAKIVFGLGALIGLVFAILLFADVIVDEDLAFLGIIPLIFGPVFGWLSSLLVYGFGELIEKTTDIANKQ